MAKKKITKKKVQVPKSKPVIKIPKFDSDYLKEKYADFLEVDSESYQLTCKECGKYINQQKKDKLVCHLCQTKL